MDVGMTGSRTAGTGAKGAAPDTPTVMIDGVTFTHPDKVLWPEQGLTKRDLVAYYNKMADRILPHVAGRPVTLLRCPSGRQAQCFVQRHAGEGVPPAVKRITLREPKGAVEYLTVDDRRGLLAMVQMGVLELHPWGARGDRPDRPDRVVLDLDPADTVPWAAVVEAAQGLRRIFAEVGFESFAMVTGGRGVHVTVPMARRLDWDQTQAFAKAVATRYADTDPKRFTVSPLKTARIGRIFIDHMRNARGNSSVAPYSPRAREGATVATPVGWDELATLAGPAAFTVQTVPERMRTLQSDPWAQVLVLQQTLTAAAKKTLGL
jgi:bifunctional non-homologous end joining protein LigD